MPNSQGLEDPMLNTDIVILAAGKGTRMRSTLPKVLHPLAGLPLLGHVLKAAQTAARAKIIVVTGHGGEQVERSISDSDILWVQQPQQLGTAHAV